MVEGDIEGGNSGAVDDDGCYRLDSATGAGGGQYAGDRGDNSPTFDEGWGSGGGDGGGGDAGDRGGSQPAFDGGRGIGGGGGGGSDGSSVSTVSDGGIDRFEANEYLKGRRRGGIVTIDDGEWGRSKAAPVDGGGGGGGAQAGYVGSNTDAGGQEASNDFHE